MKQKLLLAIFAITALLAYKAQAQTGYIYIHNKSINEANSTDFTCNISGGTTTVSAFKLNDKPDYIHVGDIGAGNGTGAGELWAISNGTTAVGTNAYNITGTIYHRSPSSSQWTSITTTGSASSVDGAALGKCVYVSNGNVYYYNGSTTTEIFFGTSASGSLGNATDVSYANGITAIVSSNGGLYYYNGGYGNNTSSNSSWNLFNAGTGNASSRIDLNATGTTLAYLTASTTAAIKTVAVNTTSSPVTNTISVNTGLSYVNGSTGTTITGTNSTTNTDICYDDAGVIYTIANVRYTTETGATGTTGIVFRYKSGDTYWTEEGEGRGLVRLTGGAGGMAWGTASVGFADAIWARASDNIGSHVWLDDERVRTTVTNGNSIMIPVTAGTYTLTETLPSSSYDLGRFNIYDPTGNTTGTPVSNSATINVASGETVNIEIINEYLVPKAIALSCTTQILQTFGTGSSSSSTEYGPAVEGTAYHYIQSSSPQDGYYFLVHDLVPGTNWFSYTNSYTVSDHTTGDVNGYFMVVNAAYAKDEFYRQRVTNLVPGLQYTISFYLANVLYNNPIKPNINYGLQDLSGNIIDSASTGNISTSGAWTYEEFTFTATTSTADLYLRNNNIGGLGNDVALDDISLNPVLTTLSANQISPTVAPNLCLGTPYTFTNTPTGGIWTSSNSAVASINPTTGVATTKTAGTVIITYTYTNQVGCVSDTTRQLIVSAAPTVTASDLLGGASCLNQADSLYSSATSTNTIASYAWVASPNSTAGLTNASVQNTSALPTASGNYTFTVTATDVVGCSASASVTLAVSAHTAPTVSLATSGADCVGNSGNFVLTSSQSGGSGSYSWSWSGTPTGNGIVNTNATSTTASPTAAGTYTYTVKVNDGFCIVPVSKTVTAYASPSVTVSPASGNITLCSGGQIALASTPSGGSGSYSYLWSASGAGNGLGATTTQNTTASPTGNGSYTYSVKVTDGNGCTATGSTTQNVTINTLLAAPTINITSPSALVYACAGVGSVSLTANVTGTGVFTYQWSGPGTITNPTSITSASVVPASTGVYTLTVTNTALCTSTKNTPVVTANAVPSVTASNFSAASCSSNSVDSLYAVATGGTGSYTYAWTTTAVPLGGSATIAASTNDTTAVTSFDGDGTYTFQVKATNAGDVNNTCSATATTSILYKYSTGPAITSMASAASYCLGSQISFSPTITAGVTYTQQTSSNTLSSGSTTNPSNTIDGSISTFGVTGSSSTRYIGLDFGSNKTITFAEVYIPNSTAATALQGATIEVSSSSNFNNVGTNTFTVGTFSSTISTAAHWETLSFTNTHNFRYIRISRTSGVALTIYEMQFYSSAATSSTNTYLWTATPSGNGLGATSTQNTTATPTAAGNYTYTLTVTDANSCANTVATSTQTINPVPSASPLSNNPAFCGTTGSVSLFGNASGGTSPLTYSWASSVVSGSASVSLDDNTLQNPTATLSTATNGSTLKFTITVTDANSCTGSASTSSIVVSSIPVASATSSLAGTACAGQTINLTGKVTSATTAPYLYSWTPSSNSTVATSSTQTSATTITTTASTTTAGNYQYGLSVFDANNCQATAATTSVLAINDAPTATISISQPSVICANPATTITLTATASGGTGTYTSYSWSGSGVVASTTASTTAVPTAAGTYTVSVTDNSGCSGTGTSSAIVIDQAAPVITPFCGSDGGSTGNIAYVMLTESVGSSWLWTTTNGSRFYTDKTLSVATDAPTSTSSPTFVVYNGTYNVAITKSNGCKGSGYITVNSSTCSGIVLASTALNFNAQKQNGGVLLTWSTTSEKPNDRFDIERSSNGVNWQTLGSVAGLGGNIANSYKYTDAAPLTGPNYYRLKQVNADGHFDYSAVRTVRFTGEWVVHVYPNPATDFLVLEFNSDKEERAAISIQTALGSTVFIKEQTIVKGLNRIKLNQIQPLAQGTYMITLVAADNVYRSKFVKGGR